MNLIAAVIAIGDELTSGHRIDTNSAWISTELQSIGIPIGMHLTVGDDLGQCVSAIRYAGSCCSLICITGGLGPTADDITRQAIAAATGRSLALDEAALAGIAAIFARRGRVMTDNNRVQAMIPVGASIIPNPHGTAPGIDLAVSMEGRDVRLIAVPGVPAEAREMFAETVISRLSLICGGARLIRAYTLKCFGPGESELESMLGELTARGRQPLVGITVHQATISLRIVATGRTVAECDAMAAPTLELIRRRLGDIVFGENEDELQHAVSRVFFAQGRTLCVGDAYSQGLLCQWLAECDAGSRMFKGGLVCGNCHELAEVLNRLGANETRLANETSFQTNASCALETKTESLARRLRDLWATDYALVMGAVPDGEQADANSLEVAVAGRRASATYHMSTGGHPDIHLARGAKFALNMLRQRYSEL